MGDHKRPAGGTRHDCFDIFHASPVTLTESKQAANLNSDEEETWQSKMR